MSELKSVYIDRTGDWARSGNDTGTFYLKSEADKVIADLEESHKKEVGQLLIENVKLKNRIAPKQSDKTLQERLNEVCEKHGVSTLQDLDWAFCESEKRRTRDCTEAAEEISHHKYKRCVAMAKWSAAECVVNQDWYKSYSTHKSEFRIGHLRKWYKRWLELAEKFKPNNSTAQQGKGNKMK